MRKNYLEETGSYLSEISSAGIVCTWDQGSLALTYGIRGGLAGLLLRLYQHHCVQTGLPRGLEKNVVFL